MSTESGREKRWTPGPWSVRRKPWDSAIWIAVGGEKCPELCAEPIGEVYGSESTEVAEANARLIAATPELVEALEANNEFLLEDRRCLLESIADAVGNITDPADGDGLQEIDALLEKNRAALSKAYGETP